MIYSMTGYGRSESQMDDSTVLFEIRSINGKNADINIRMPQQFKPFEIDFRNQILDKLQRGSIDFYITMKENGSARPMSINTNLVNQYISSLGEVAERQNLDPEIFYPSILSLPEIASPTVKEWSDEDKQKLLVSLDEAIESVENYRKVEGEKIKKYMDVNIQEIREKLPLLEAEEESRLDNLRNRIRKNAEDLSQTVDFDKNRLEQELFYYIEKLDIGEEKQRLNSHLDYFDEISNNDHMLKGKKLNFISQEIGRELNTLGSKSYNSEMQKIVIQMKDALEKIKEQLANVL